MKKRERTRAHLLEVAIELFGEQGYEATTMRQIARAADLGTGTAYYHFPSKESLVFAFYAQTLDHTEAAIAEARLQPDLAGRFAHYVRWRLARLQPHHAFLGVLAAAILQPRSPLSPFGATTARLRAREMDNLTQLLADDQQRDPLLAKLLWVAWMAILYGWLHQPSPSSPALDRGITHASRLLGLGIRVLDSPLGSGLRPDLQGLIDGFASPPPDPPQNPQG